MGRLSGSSVGSLLAFTAIATETRRLAAPPVRDPASVGALLRESGAIAFRIRTFSGPTRARMGECRLTRPRRRARSRSRCWPG